VGVDLSNYGGPSPSEQFAHEAAHERIVNNNEAPLDTYHFLRKQGMPEPEAKDAVEQAWKQSRGYQLKPTSEVGTLEGTGRTMGQALAETGKLLSMAPAGVVAAGQWAKNEITGTPNDTDWTDAYFKHVTDPIQASIDAYAPKEGEHWSDGAKIGGLVGDLALQVAEFTAVPEAKGAKLEEIAMRFGPKVASAVEKLVGKIAPKLAERVPQGEEAAAKTVKAARGLTHDASKSTALGVNASGTQADRLAHAGVPAGKAVAVGAANLPANIGFYKFAPGMKGRLPKRFIEGYGLGLGIPYLEGKTTHAIAPSVPAPDLSDYNESGLIAAGMASIFGGKGEARPERVRKTGEAKRRKAGPTENPDIQTIAPTPAERQAGYKSIRLIPGADGAMQRVGIKRVGQSTPLALGGSGEPITAKTAEQGANNEPANPDTPQASKAKQALESPEVQARIRSQIDQVEGLLAEPDIDPDERTALRAHREQLEGMLKSKAAKTVETTTRKLGRSINALANRARQGKSQKKDAVRFKGVAPKATKILKNKADVDASGFTHEIDNSSVRHALKRHGNPEAETRRGQGAVTVSDFAKVPDVVRNPDRVEYAGTTHQGLPVLRYYKRINGHMVVVEEARTGKNQLSLVTMWKTRAAPDAPRSPESSAPTSENVRPESSNSDSIPSEPSRAFGTREEGQLRALLRPGETEYVGRSNGKPFATEKGAQKAAHSRGLAGYEPVKVHGGFALKGVPRTEVGQKTKTSVPRRVEDMSEAEKNRALLTDEQTGLGSRRAFDEAEARAPYVMILDIDGLKTANDTFGHHAGDTLIRADADRLKAAFGDDAYRIGGDEFAVVGDDPAVLRRKAERVNKALAEHTLAVRKNGHTIDHDIEGFSYGIGTDRIEADNALYAHKAERAQKGLRNPRGEKPQGVSRSRPAREHAPLEKQDNRQGDVSRKEAVEAGAEPSEQAARHQTEGRIEELPVDELTLSEDVPQFKAGANNQGVVEPLGGEFDRRGVGPIQVWRRNNGKLEVISGRHRLDLAKRSGEKTIPAQVYDESAGFDQQQAASLDAELNIRDGQGEVADYVQYFQRPAFRGDQGRREAESRGLLARATGRRAYTIARSGTPELIAAHRAGELTDQAAVQIAEAAPDNTRLQTLGMKQVQQGRSIAQAANTMRAVEALGGDSGDNTGDLFGGDDSGIRDAEQMAKAATAKQRAIAERLAAVTGAAKRPELARKEGVNVNDPQAVNRRVRELKSEESAWDHWQTDPDKISELRTAAGLDREKAGERPGQKANAINATAPSSEGVSVSERDAPWRMTKAEWDRAREASRPNTAQSNNTRHSASEAQRDLDRVQWLTYDVKAAARQRLEQAEQGGIKLTPDELDDLDWELHTPATHRDVVEKALREGRPVPEKVLEDYPELQQGVSDSGLRLSRQTEGERTAPNGEPSNLNARQYEQIRTPKFRKWFGAWRAKARATALRHSKPVRIDSGELTGLEGAALRDSAKDVYTRLAKKGPVTTRDNREVRLTPVGFKKTRSHSADPKTLRIVPQLRTLFEQAVPLWSDTVKRRTPQESVRAYHNYGAKARFDDGDYYVRLVVREDVNGNIYYDNELSQVEKIGEGVEADQYNETGAAPVTDKKKLRAWLAKVNRDSASKVVDANGEPLVVYHETSADFSVFDPNRKGASHDDDEAPLGIFAKSKPRHLGLGSAQMPVFLDIKSPRIWASREEAVADLKGMIKGVGDAQGAGMTPEEVQRAIREHLVAEGYDGVHLRRDGLTTDAWIAFHPEQVKSAIGNTGEYNPDNPSILHSRQADRSQELRDLYDRAKKNPRLSETVELRPLTEEEVTEARRNGVNLKGYSHSADSYAFRHTDRKHGNAATEEQRGQLAVTPDDIARIPEVIDSPDAVVYGLKNKRGQDQVAYLKRFDDGTELYVTEARTGRKRLAMESVRKYPAATRASSILKTLGLNVRDDGGDRLSIVRRGKAGKPTGQTPATLRTALQKALGKPFQTLERTGRIRIVQSVADLPKAIRDEAARFQKVFHGSPHHGIEQTGFKLQKIGTGEGNQAYGWGLYFAGKRGIAEAYRKALSAGGGLEVEDVAARALQGAGGSYPKAIAELKARVDNLNYRRRVLPETTGTQAPGETTLERALAMLRRGDKVGGQVYRADVPDDSELLDWDKPLSGQPAGVQEKVYAVIDAHGMRDFREAWQQSLDKKIGELSRDEVGRGSTGGELYRALTKRTGSARAASKALDDAGIPGLRYLDGNSRSEGEGSYNYVIWDEGAIGDVGALYSKQADIGGVYHNGKIYLVADHIKPGTETGVLLHEGSHASVGEVAGLKQIIGHSFDDITRHFNRLLDNGDPLARRAYERANTAAPSFDWRESTDGSIEVAGKPVDIRDALKAKGVETKGRPSERGLTFGRDHAEAVRGAVRAMARVNAEERLTYFVEEAANAQKAGTLTGSAKLLYRRIIASLRAWFSKTPLARKLAANGHELKLTPDDFVALAKQALRKQARAVEEAKREGFSMRRNGDGTLKVFGDRGVIRATLADAGVEARGIKSKDGLTFGVSQVQAVEEALQTEPQFARGTAPTAFTPEPGRADKFRRQMRKSIDDLRSFVPPMEVTRMPAVMKALGVRDLPVMVSRDVLRKASNGVKHDVSLKTLERLPEELNDPVAVFVSDSHPKDAFVALTELKDDSGRPVIVALDVRAKGKRYAVTRIASIYGKDGARDYFANLIKNDRLAYKSDRAAESPVLDGLQLPNRITDERGLSKPVLTEADILSRFSKATPQFRTRLNPKGTLKGFGDRDAIRDALKAQGIKARGIKSKDGLTFGVSQAEKVQAALAETEGPRFSVSSEDFEGPLPEARPASEGHGGGIERAIPKALKPRYHHGKQAARDVIDEARRFGQDQFIDLQRMQERIVEAGAAIPDHLNTREAIIRYHGRRRARLNAFHERAVKPLIDLMAANDFSKEDVDAFLKARHHDERVKRIRQINPDPEKGSGITDEQANATLEKYADNEAMHKIGVMVDNITQLTRNLMVESGLEKPETVAGWEDMWDYYVPLTGFADEKVEALFDQYSPGHGKGFASQYKTKHALGRKSESANALLNVFAQHEATITLAEKNLVQQTLLDMAEAFPSDEWEVDKVKTKPILTRGKPSGGQRNLGLEELHFDPESGQVKSVLDRTIGDDEIVVSRNGVKHVITFKGHNGTHFARVFKNLDSKAMGPVMQRLAAMQHYFAWASTSANVFFAPRNFTRDGQTAFIVMKGTILDGRRGEVMKDVPKMMRAVWRGERGTHADAETVGLYREFRLRGGRMGAEEGYQDAKAGAKYLDKQLRAARRGKYNPAKYGKALLDTLDAYNVAVENSLRLSAYKHAKQAYYEEGIRMGLTEAQSLEVAKNKAAVLAKELTVNFDRKGTAGRELNSLFLFYNAAIQGGARFAKSMASPKVRKFALKAMLGAAMLPIANRLIGGQDQDGRYYYDKVPEYVKRGSLVIMLPPALKGIGETIGGGSYLSIPIPYEFGIVKNFGAKLGDAASAAMGMTHFDAGSASVDLMNDFFRGFTPFDTPAKTPLQTFAPTEPASTFAGIKTGKTWYGAPLYPDKNPYDLAKKPDAQLQWRSTTDASKAIAHAINRWTGGDKVVPGAVSISPITMDEVFHMLTGGAGAAAGRTFDTTVKLAQGKTPSSRDVPFLRTFYGQADNLRVNKNRFYANKTQLKYAEKDLKAYRGNIEKRKAVRERYRVYLRAKPLINNTYKRMKRLEDAIDRLRDRDIPQKFRQRRIRQLQSEMKRLLDRANARIERMKDAA
jgi:diguanylate cyclase (GGDEF)-like protein